MHKIEEIEKALNLLDTYDRQLSKTARASGINRYTLRSWRDKRKKGEPLILRTRNKSSKWSKEKGYGCISTVITSPGDYLITQIDTSKVGEYKLRFKATDRNGVSQEKYVTIKVIKKEDNNTLAIIILTSFIVIVLAIGGITVFIIKKIRKSK